VYIPFGEVIMNLVQTYLFEGTTAMKKNTVVSGGLNDTMVQQTTSGRKIWDVDRSTVRGKLNSSRLEDQMFAYVVTNQIVNAFLEVVFPFIQRGLNSLWSRKQSSGKKKRVAFEDETDGKGEGEEDKAEREFLENVRNEVALPEYELFDDYSEMVTQFGYVTMWSTIWPLAPREHVILDYGGHVMADDTRSHGPHKQCR
jgi:anoctamin-10